MCIRDSIYTEDDGLITFTDSELDGDPRPLLLLTPGVLFAHHGDGKDGGGHGHALKEPLPCNVASEERSCFEWPGNYLSSLFKNISEH